MQGGKSGAESLTTKKLVIKPFKTQPKLPENLFQSSWESLQNALESVFRKNASTLTKEELYRTVEDLCKHKMGDKLYSSVREVVTQYIGQKVEILLSNQHLDSFSFLEVVVNVWQDYCEQMSTIRNIFLYLDRNYALPLSQAPSPLSTSPSPSLSADAVLPLWELGLLLFYSRFHREGALVRGVVAGMLKVVDMYRRGQLLSPTLLPPLSNMLLALRCYEETFEKEFFLEAARFYREEGEEAMRGGGGGEVRAFLRLVDKRLHEVFDLTSHYLPPSSRAPLLATLTATLLSPHLTALVERGLPMLLEEGGGGSGASISSGGADWTEVRKIYMVAERVDGGRDVVRAHWGNYIKRVGEQIVAPPKASAPAPNPSAQAANSSSAPAAPAREVIEEVIGLQEKMGGVLKDAFSSHPTFATTLRSSLEHVVNFNLSSLSEQLARYADRILRGGGGGGGGLGGEGEGEGRLAAVLGVFKLLGEKDIFEAFYKKYLAKRLLQGKSASSDLERSMLSKLRAECGSNYTSKLEGMFSDVDLSLQIQANFNTHLSTLSTPAPFATPELSMLVLTQGYWPTPPAYPALLLPAECAHMEKVFETWYHSVYGGRKLTPLPSLSRVVVVYKRGAAYRRELEVTLGQGVVLRLWGAGGVGAVEGTEEGGVRSLTVQEISTHTGLTGDELHRTLLSLCNGPPATRILSKHPKGKEVGEADVFVPALAYASKMYRVKIPMILPKEVNSEEVAKTHEEIIRDRAYILDALIVRIMKSRKRIIHSALCSEVMSLSRFSVSAQDIKQRVEGLIQRDFISRDTEDITVYHYVA
eukprot:gene25008-30209_t